MDGRLGGDAADRQACRNSMLVAELATLCGMIQRKVERANERTRSDRLAFPHASVPFSSRRDFEILHFAVHSYRFFGHDTERVDQPRHLATRILDRFAGFDASRIGHFIESFGESLNAVVQHVLPFVRRHFAIGSAASTVAAIAA